MTAPWRNAAIQDLTPDAVDPDAVRFVDLESIGQIRISGGGTKSSVWRRILAEILGGELVSVETACEPR